MTEAEIQAVSPELRENRTAATCSKPALFRCCARKLTRGQERTGACNQKKIPGLRVFLANVRKSLKTIPTSRAPGRRVEGSDFRIFTPPYVLLPGEPAQPSGVLLFESDPDDDLATIGGEGTGSRDEAASVGSVFQKQLHSLSWIRY